MILAPEATKIREIDPWDKLYNALDKSTPVEGVIVRVLWGEKQAWEIGFNEFEGVRGLVFQEEAGLPKQLPMHRFIGQRIAVVIKAIDRKENLILCSRKEAVEEAKKILMRSLEEGQELTAIIRLINSNALYVDIGGGVLEKIPKEKAWSTASVPLYIQYNLGQPLKVKVEHIDRENQVLSISAINPWENINLKRGEFVVGTVVKISDRHVWVKIPQGVFGLGTYPLRKTIKEGDKVSCRILNYNSKKRKLHLELLNQEVW